MPETSTSLLRAISGDSASRRWTEFAERYRPMMLAYLAAHFPSVDADDMVQDTLIALAAALPHYTYAPDETGHFRNYLTGILRHKAMRAVARERRGSEVMREYGRHGETRETPDSGDSEWRVSLMEIALRQVLADETIHERTREVFRRVAVNGEKPDAVAHSFGIARNAVDQMKNRVMTRLKALVRNLERADG